MYNSSHDARGKGRVRLRKQRVPQGLAEAGRLRECTVFESRADTSARKLVEAGESRRRRLSDHSSSSGTLITNLAHICSSAPWPTLQATGGLGDVTKRYRISKFILWRGESRLIGTTITFGASLVARLAFLADPGTGPGESARRVQRVIGGC